MSWALYESDGTGQWRHIPRPKALAEAARHIIEAESIPARTLIAELHIDANAGSDDAALTQIEFKGARACYVIRRTPR